MAKKAAAAPAAANDDSATTEVNVADFRRTRDSVIVALATLQTSVQDLSRAYIQHANTVLAPERGGTLDANLTNILSESGLLASASSAIRPAEAAPEEGGKKKRKRAAHDPNAPKRALTPYFLYMQSARSQIARELGEQAKPKEVADEGTRRWQEMPQSDKAVWDEQYQKNLAAYRVKTAAYKAGQPVPSDEEAASLVEAGKAPELAAIVDDAAAETEEDEAPEPAKVPTPPPKASKRRKTTDTPAKVEAAPAPKSPEKDKKGKKGKAAAAVEAAPAAPAKVEKKKKAKKA